MSISNSDAKKLSSMSTTASARVNDYPIMHNLIIACHTQSNVADKILTEYFLEFWSKIALLLACPNKYTCIFGG